MRALPCTALLLSAVLFSACSSTVSSVSTQAKVTLSGALAPVNNAVDEASRRAGEVREGIQEVTEGVLKVKGAFSGSGSTW